MPEASLYEQLVATLVPDQDPLVELCALLRAHGFDEASWYFTYDAKRGRVRTIHLVVTRHTHGLITLFEYPARVHRALALLPRLADAYDDPERCLAHWPYGQLATLDVGRGWLSVASDYTNIRYFAR